GLLLATLMAGIILVIGALFRAGSLIALIPEPVIEVFTIGIALIIGFSQLKDLLGLTIAKLPADLVDALPALWVGRHSASLIAAAVGLSTIIAIAALRWRLPRLPVSIIVIGIAAAAVVIFGLPVETIGSRFGNLPSGLPMPSLPHI